MPQDDPEGHRFLRLEASRLRERTVRGVAAAADADGEIAMTASCPP